MCLISRTKPAPISSIVILDIFRFACSITGTR